MKRVVYLIIFIFCIVNPAIASCNYSNFCPQYKPSLFHKTSKFVSKYTGSTYVAEKVIQNLIAKKLENVFHQKFNVFLTADSASELFGGVFRSLNISSNNVNIQGIHVSALKVTTLCNKNSINLNSKPVKLRENMVLAFWAELSDNDLKETFSNAKYLDAVNGLNLSSLGIASYKLNPSTIKIKNNKLCFTVNAKPCGSYPTMDIAVSADMMIKEGNVEFSKVDFVNLYTGFDPTKFQNALNPNRYLNLNVYLYGNQSADIKIQNLIISNNKIVIDGVALMPKSFD